MYVALPYCSPWSNVCMYKQYWHLVNSCKLVSVHDMIHTLQMLLSECIMDIHSPKSEDR